MVVREAAVERAVQLVDRAAEGAEDRRRDRAGRGVAGVDHGADRPRQAREVAGEVGVVAGDDVDASRRGRGRTARWPDSIMPAQRLDLGAVDSRAADADLEAVVRGRVVAAGHLDRAVEVEVEEREVDDRGRADAEVDDVEPDSSSPSADRGGVGVGSEAAIAPDADASRARPASALGACRRRSARPSACAKAASKSRSAAPRMSYSRKMAGIGHRVSAGAVERIERARRQPHA